jgi:hypothetical protein
MMLRKHWRLLAAMAIAVAIVGLAAVSLPGPVAAPELQLPLTPDSVNLNASPSGHILFGSPLPVAEILPTVNGSPAATLGLTHLLEIAANASDPEHPTVVAEAAPETLAGFNGTISYNGTPNYYNIIATLPVYSTNSALWVSGVTLGPTTSNAKQAILDVNYSVAAGTDGSPGVRISWTVAGWPWANPVGDELALEFVVQVNAGSGFNTCSGAPSTDAPDAACTTEPLALGQAVWSSTFTALKGSGPSGSVAWVSWGSQVAGSDAKVAPVSAGAYFEQPGTSALVIAAPAPAGGATSVSGSTLFLLSPGSEGNFVATLVGDLPAYGGAAAVFAAGATIGILLSRRRDRAIARELAS